MKWRAFLSALVVIFAGSLLHFAWEWSGRSTVVAVFAATNESTWEHLKLAFWPALALTPLQQTFYGSLPGWLPATAIRCLLPSLVIVVLFYGYTALLGGHIQMVSDAGWGPMIDTGKARLLAVMGEARARRLPDVPTLTELGYPIVASNPVGIAGPKGMDPAIVAVLQQAFHRASRDAEYNRALESADQPHMLMDSAAYTDYAVRQVAQEKQFVAELGLKTQ